MLVTVLGLSVVPLLIDLGNGSESPFLFNAAWRLGVVLGTLFFLVTFFLPLIRVREALVLILRRIPNIAILLATIGNCEYVLFALSSRFVDIAVTTIIYEIWPIFLIFLTAWLFRSDARYHNVTTGLIPLLVLAFVGFVFVIGSPLGQFEDLIPGSGSYLTTLAGILLAMFAALLAPLMAFGFRWGSDLTDELNEHFGDIHFDDMFCVVIAFAVSSSGSAIFNAGVGFILGESLGVRSLLIAIIGGLVANAMGGIAWRKANFITDNLGINAIAYGVPIFSLLWLYLFSDIDVVRTDYLVMGTAAIIAANLLINLEAEIEFGFKALIMSLWACGAVVYLRPEEWVWVGSEGYFGVLGLSATLFTLILAFRVARFVDRTSYEDNAMYSIFHTLDLLARRGVVAGQVRDNMMSLDAARNIEDTYVAYGDIKLNLQSAQSTAQTPDDQLTLSQTDASLDSVIHSKQRGNNFGEFFALIVFAVITVAMALLARPEQSGWTGFLVEMFTFPFCAIIVFLTFNAWDVHRDWLAAVFSRDPESGWYGVLIRDESNRDFEQWASVVIGLAVAVTYAFLLWQKWLG